MDKFFIIKKNLFLIFFKLILFKELNETEAEIKESFQLILKVWKLCQIIFIKSSPCNIKNSKFDL